MDKVYKHQEVEKKWYDLWEKSGYFVPDKDPNLPAGKAGKKPFSVILPPPNANADLHMGHTMYTVEDIMVRYHRMKGDATLWLPGADHAGFETQYVFEKHLAKEGKSRFEYDRETLYQMIWDFVQKNRGNMEHQLRRLGFSLDWTRNTFTLDPKIVEIVYKTFKKLYDDGIVYRSERLVNYCTKDGTSFSDLEVNYVERNDPLYFMKYGPFTIATVRPETKFRDTALAVNPKDKRYKQHIGKTFDIQGLLGNVKMIIIPDESVDPKFGTGIMKVTPAHDPHDFELGKKFNLPVTPIIDFKGRMDFSWFMNKKDVPQKYLDRAKKYHGQKVLNARKMMVEDLKEDGLLLKTDEKYVHRIGVCYKCGAVIEPLPMKQWYIKIEQLADKAIDAIKKKKIKFVPKRFEKTAIRWLTNFHDWNISRQIVWGIRIPAWKCLECSKDGKEQWMVTSNEKPDKCTNCGGNNLQQDSDTFDTWFSSGQWPYATLLSREISNFKFPRKNSMIEFSGQAISNLKEKYVDSDFNYFYPTSVMETGYDILPWWVLRMIMLGIYMTGDVPFKTVYLHGLVRDAKGQKMSKSKGNVINPLVMADTYGADALRIALIYGSAAGNDIPLSEDKIRGMRNFSNKLWNIGRFLISNPEKKELKNESKQDVALKSLIETTTKQTTQDMEKFVFGQAAERIYEVTWHKFADIYIEEYKKGLISYSLLFDSFVTLLKLLHPFMPFITEEIHKQLVPNAKPLIISPWPKS